MADKDYPEFDARGVPTDGRYLAMKLVMGGLALQACTVSMVDGRDTILDADVALTGGENQCEIWTAFAKRGLGHGAKHTEFGNEGDDKVPPMCFMYTGDYDDPDDACLGAGKVEIETATPMKSKVEIGSSTRPPVQLAARISTPLRPLRTHACQFHRRLLRGLPARFASGMARFKLLLQGHRLN
ncbi:hypothetical protein G6O67_000952 [Ophiocordyceps sinensis]|uniref:Extracellular metalloproteinase n=1 Tax=Ophiocordyceps sinensis TaxID=72228 RepID=A0A8H4VAH2_9HYPO|nr:hypothetical protein G6O67_000952 [Ophiocordyceps sinensis]